MFPSCILQKNGMIDPLQEAVKRIVCGVFFLKRMLFKDVSLEYKEAFEKQTLLSTYFKEDNPC